MFTGIVESVGKVLSLTEDKDSWILRLSVPFPNSEGLEEGASLSVNGCCLTLREEAHGEASFDLLEESIRKTSIKSVSLTT